MLSVEQVVTERFPTFVENKPKLITKPTMGLLRLLFHEKETNRFLEEHKGLAGLDFIEKVLEYFDLDYTVSRNDLENIPPTGRVVIVANHPLGALDALSLIQMVGSVRKDVKVIANDMLAALEPLKELMLTVDNISGSTKKSSVQKILDCLKNDEALIVFPAGEVSRLRPNGVRDGKWKHGFLQFAKRTQSPILPVHIDARNSAWFYSISMLSKPLSAMFLMQEIFRQRANVIGFKVGELIPIRFLEQKGLRNNIQTKMLRKHLYRLAGKKPGLFQTEKSIAHPESRQIIKQELRNGELLGETSDGKQIILVDWFPESSVIREIGRLRELSFRKVGEGTGERRDLDKYDQHYRHLVLWDNESLEIVGAYRLGEGNNILEKVGKEGFYSANLFKFKQPFETYLEDSLELGRSFVQPNYWGSRALDYLWQGLGAYLRHHPEIKYLFGPVSISAHYPQSARDMLVYFYSHYFGHSEKLVSSNNPCQLSEQALEEFQDIFKGDDFCHDLKELKNRMSMQNMSIPTLYKQYSDLCEEDGVKFLDFGIDPDFSGCTDGFLLVDVSKIKQSKRKRYIDVKADR